MPSWMKLARNIVGGLTLLVLLIMIGAWLWSYPAAPGRFFKADVTEDARPGQLIKSQAYKRGLPEGASARRILYTTTLSGGVPATASAIVMWKGLETDPGPRRMVAWAHGTLGTAPGCGASLQADPFADVPGLSALLDEGWVYVATDYAGLTTAGPHPYLIGDGEARSVLDAARAAHDLPELTLSLETVIWGYSQGGHAALWSAILARGYAPELQIRGIATLAPAADIPAIVAQFEAGAAGRLFSSFMARAYADTYPDLYFSGIVQPGARWQANEISKRCLSGRSAPAAVLLANRFSGGSIFRGGDTGTRFRKRLAENIPTRPFGAPVLILQGRRDDVVSAKVQAGYARDRCAAGEAIDYQVFDALDHVSITGPDAPTVPVLIKWTQARFAGTPAPIICPK
ncbi:lipase family protein [Hyphomonas hirschiana VP5]|nr:lipase family protein [Hyphomonas hirschiana VP5]